MKRREESKKKKLHNSGEGIAGVSVNADAGIVPAHEHTNTHSLRLTNTHPIVFCVLRAKAAV